MRCGDFRETYIKDEEIFQSLFVKWWLGLFFVFLLIFPFVANAYLLYVANMIHRHPIASGEGALSLHCNACGPVYL